MQKDILVQGRIYVSENHLCFHANIFGWITNVVLPFSNVTSIEKKMTAFVIPNAIGIVSRNGKVHTFASFISRDATFDVFVNVWRHSKLDQGSRQGSIAESTEDHYAAGGNGDGAGSNGTPGKTKGAGGAGAAAGHKPTQCDCEKKGEHYSEIILDTTFPTSPANAYNLMFTSTFLKDFMKNNQKLTGEFSFGKLSSSFISSVTVPLIVD